MVGRGLLSASLVAAALALVGAAQAHAQDDGQRLVMVHNNDPAQISALDKQGYDVGYVGEPTEAAVYITSAQEGLLRAQGYTIGEVVADDADWQARQVEMAKTDEAQ